MAMTRILYFNMQGNTWKSLSSKPDIKDVIMRDLMNKFKLSSFCIFDGMVKMDLEYNSESCNIYLLFDMDKFKYKIEHPIEMTFREELVSMLSFHNSRIGLNYVTKSINMYVDRLLEKSKITPDHEKETPYYTYDGRVSKINSYYINLETGGITKKISKKKLNITGRIISGLDNSWMDDIISLRSTEKKSIKGYMNIKATLFIGNSYIIGALKDKIKKKKGVCIMITDAETHNQYSYLDIINSDYVLIGDDYLGSIGYRNLTESYRMGSRNLDTEIAVMRAEYTKNKPRIMSYKSPHLSLFNWERIVNCSISMIEKKEPRTLLRTMRSNHRWLYLAKMTDIYYNFSDYIGFLFNDREFNLPLMDSNDNVVYIDDVFIFYKYTQPEFKTEVCSVEMNKTELEVYNMMLDMGRNMNQIARALDLRGCNHTKPVNSIDICDICYNESDPTKFVILGCGHMMCTGCTGKINKTSKKCPYCRSDYDITELTFLTSDDNTKCLRLQRYLDTHIKQNYIVLVSNKTIFTRIATNNRDKKTIRCNGNKKQKIDEYNRSTEKQTIMIILMKDYQLLSRVKKRCNLVFYNYPYDDKKVNKDILTQIMFNNKDNINKLVYMVYTDSIEQELVQSR